MRQDNTAQLATEEVLVRAFSSIRLSIYSTGGKGTQLITARRSCAKGEVVFRTPTSNLGMNTARGTDHQVQRTE